MRKRSSRIEAKTKKPKGDLLTWKTWIVLGPVLYGLVWIARSNRATITPILFLLTAILAPGLGDAWEGPRRRWASLIATLTAGLGIGMWWPGRRTQQTIETIHRTADRADTIHYQTRAIYWAAFVVPIALAIWATTLIGRRSTKARVAHRARHLGQAARTLAESHGDRSMAKARAFLRDITPSVVEASTGRPYDPAMAPKLKLEDYKYDPEVGVETYWFDTSAALKIPETVRAISGFQSKSTQTIALYDLHAERSGLWKLVITDKRPFQFTMPAIPAIAEWPAHHYPAGVNAHRQEVYIPCNFNSYTAGETGAGKTDAMLNRAHATIAHPDRMLVAIDLKKVDFVSVAPHCYLHADTIPDAINALLWARHTVGERLDWMKANGHRNWKPEFGPFIDLLTDECSDLFGMSKEAIELGGEIAHLCRAAGLFTHWATQHPTVDSLPRIIKVNTPVTIGLRVGDGSAARSVNGEDSQKDGFDTSPKAKLPEGRAVVTIPGKGRTWVQLHQAAEKPPKTEPARTPAPPLAWPAPSAVRPSAPQEAPHTQGEQAADGRTDGHNLSTDLSPDLKGLEARILPILNGYPLSGRQVAEAIGASPDGVNKALKRLETKGYAVQNGGWLRAT